MKWYEFRTQYMSLHLCASSKINAWLLLKEQTKDFDGNLKWEYWKMIL